MSVYGPEQNCVRVVVAQDNHNTFRNGPGQNCVMVGVAQDNHNTFRNGLGQNCVMVVVAQDIHSTFQIDLGNCSSDSYADSSPNLVLMLCRMLLPWQKGWDEEDIVCNTHYALTVLMMLWSSPEPWQIWPKSSLRFSRSEILCRSQSQSTTHIYFGI